MQHVNALKCHGKSNKYNSGWSLPVGRVAGQSDRICETTWMLSKVPKSFLGKAGRRLDTGFLHKH